MTIDLGRASDLGELYVCVFNVSHRVVDLCDRLEPFIEAMIKI